MPTPACTETAGLSCLQDTACAPFVTCAEGC
jgi:hypothetical protein